METVQKQHNHLNTKKKNLSAGQKGRLSMRLQWMNEFSDVGSVLSDINTLHLSKAVSSHLEYKSSSAVNSLEPEADNEDEQKGDKKNSGNADHKRPRRKTTINFLFDLIQKH